MNTTLNPRYALRFVGMTSDQHQVLDFVDPTTGDVFARDVRFCSSPRCPRFGCREHYHDSRKKALYTVVAHHRYCSLITVPRLTGLDQAHQVQDAVCKVLRRVLEDGASHVSVVEKHKAAYRDLNAENGLHVHVLVFHDSRLTVAQRRAVECVAGSTTHVVTYRSDDHRVNPGYLLKNYLSHYEEHLRLNRGRIFRQSRGLWQTPVVPGDSKHSRWDNERFQAERQRAFRQVRGFLPDAKLLCRAHGRMSGVHLIGLARTLSVIEEALRRRARMFLRRRAVMEALGVFVLPPVLPLVSVHVPVVRLETVHPGRSPPPGRPLTYYLCNNRETASATRLHPPSIPDPIPVLSR